MVPPDDDDGAEIDEALRSWRQGDCVKGQHWFLFRTDPQRPLTEEARAASAQGHENAETEVSGFVVVSQTCDIVRSCADRPFVEVSPLVDVPRGFLREVERGRRPSRAFIPGVERDALVADLDRVMTVEKSVVSGWSRIPGCTTDAQVRRLSLALARKRSRAAFPDDFSEFARPLMQRMSSKHDKHNDEGQALRVLREIRVRAAPEWDAPAVELLFSFIRDEDEPEEFTNARWDLYLEKWLTLLPKGGRFVDVAGVVQRLEDMTARDYVESDPLDLDYLSVR